MTGLTGAITLTEKRPVWNSLPGLVALVLTACLHTSSGLAQDLTQRQAQGSSPEAAQGLDVTAPIIELEELSDGTADRNQVFTVLIAEDNTLQDAVLYYRREGQLPYTPAPMQALGDTGYHSVSIPTDNTDLRTIEYYVQARDEAGNRTVSGFAFDPYRRTLKPPGAPLQRPESTSAVTPPVLRNADDASPLLSRRWVQVALGVLAVGAIVSLADDGGEDTVLVPLTFNVE